MLDDFKREEALFHFQRGVILERANRVREAVEEYRRAVAHYPHLREAHDALGFYYQRYGLLAKAAEEFRVVATLENDFLSHFNLGCVLLELGRHSESLTAFERCLEMEPGDAAVCYEIGMLYFLRGDYAAALDYFYTPLKRYPDDWELLELVGQCLGRSGSYNDARAVFHKALRLVSEPSAQAAMIEHIRSIERYREVRKVQSVKDQLYASHGIVYLGSAQDNGMDIKPTQDYHFTYPDIGVTLRRFLTLYQGCGWYFTCIVSMDRLSSPLAEALSKLLCIPRCSVEELEPTDLPLLVLAVGHEAELLELVLERVPCPVVTFCLGLNWSRHSNVLSDILGIVAQGVCAVPWESELRRLRSDGAPTRQINVCLQQATDQVMTAVHDTPSDSNSCEQLNYYMRVYPRLRFSDEFNRIDALIGV
ncbi:MAG: tetratricopeptide repeat protein [Chloroflexi bacterium AL-W]|nr:tetratricopeptide repeat protein [Chloroflexi bacterium AL-N1]NOK65583.1 tetratricopeptide repeat protein [Chloroflexi bacterium AL-N10]NOK74476.1 tetratricopeptide repeat protein [Chloroflexi bacterium AL-N5]NOK80616.1 tetratricopeptide repeat protein [Chloroflexi bacterium AL-W]NOK88734.1 tetratricopeptide repeat protein [Chloroflexi bacterium AL-N15]